jgi:PIN domain nuclease of toxin-antitoxin system
MLKVTAITTALIVLGAAFVAASTGRKDKIEQETQPAAVSMHSFFELHNRAHLENLPVQEASEPF